MDDKQSSSKCSLSSTAHLPLAWTRIKRRRKRQKTVTTDGDESNIKGGAGNKDMIWFCCEDPLCANTDQEISYKHKFGRKRKSSSSAQSKMTSLKGKGIFCLHSLDCTWFQGHFIPSRMNASSFGLLAVQREDVDACLQCKDGGYKEIDLTILSASKKKRTVDSGASKSNGMSTGNDQEGRKKSEENGNGNCENGEEGHRQNDNTLTRRRRLKVEKLQCTGGDMLRITTPKNGNDNDDLELERDSTTSVDDGNTNTDISFDAERIITGPRVEPLVRKYFANLVSSMSRSSSNADSDSLSDLLPDCAIVIGEMYIRVPSEFVYGRENELNNGSRLGQNAVDDDWLE